MSSGGQERTEKATPQRMKKVRADGGLGKSQDLSAWIGVGAAAAMLPSVVADAFDLGQRQLRQVQQVIADPDPMAATEVLFGAITPTLSVLAPLFGAVAAAVLIVSVAQTGVHVKKLKPRFQQFNLGKGIKRTFGAQAAWQGVKAVAKTAVVGVVLYAIIQSMTPLIMASGVLPAWSLVARAGEGVRSMLWAAVAAGLLLAVADVFVVMRRNRKQTRMTRQEVREENKNTEGDPQLKAAIRSKQLAMSRNRMMAAVADADVVIVNPTHVAVALRYQPGTGAPRVVAKGSGHVAARIRDMAAEHRVPMVEDVPLARTLHAVCELGQEIPADLYAAVARVLAFVMALRRRGSSAGLHRAPAAAGAVG